MSDATRVRLRVSGRVQGVGFRWFVREHARRLGLSGWVLNEPGGDVVLEVEGPAGAVGELQALVRRGPDAARVEEVQELLPGRDPLPAPFSVHRP